MANRFLFGSGTARGGTGIVVQTLAAHSQIDYALDPALAMCRGLRNTVVRDRLSTTDTAGFDPQEPMSDYFFSTTQARILEAMIAADLDHAIGRGDLAPMIASMEARAVLDSGDLVPHMKNLSGATFRDLFVAMADLVARVRSAGAASCRGFHENWAVEVMPAVARSLPDAAFIIVLRDPRAVLASHDAAEEHLRSSFLSYVRGLRKLHELAHAYLGMPLFRDRLCVVTYEELVRHPEKTAAAFCDFLDLPFEAGMTDPEKHLEPGKTTKRDGVSSFETMAVGYNPDRIDRWRRHLTGQRLTALEAAVDPMMRRFGYFPLTQRSPEGDGNALAAAIAADIGQMPKWRTDRLEPAGELGRELARRHVLADPAAPDALARQCFLRPEALEYARRPAPAESGDAARGGIWFAGAATDPVGA